MGLRIWRLIGKFMEPCTPGQKPPQWSVDGGDWFTAEQGPLAM